MDIIIGKLGNQPFSLTESSISRKHAIFHKDEQTGIMTLRDTNSANGTYILAGDGSFKRINGEVKVGLNTLVRLGAIHTFKIKELLKKVESNTEVDISKLRDVYEIYSNNKISIESQTSGIMMLRIFTMTLSTVVANFIVLAVVDDSMEPLTKGIIQGVVTIIVLALSWVLVGIKNSSLIRRKNQNELYFKKNYCCPKCGYHFGNHIYSNILAEGVCPNKSCKCKFKGN